MRENCEDETNPWWTVQRGPGPVLATAIHDGHGIGAKIAPVMKLSDADRLREEDPFTGQATLGVATHVIAHRSRFEFDLNRAPGEAIYLTPEQSWGLEVWNKPLSEAAISEALAIHHAYYGMLGGLLDSIASAHPKFVLIDVHSYNHRRDGAGCDPTPPEHAPDINIGTFSMPRDEWAWLLDPLIEAMRGFDFNGRRLDVRENVAFQGKGEQTRFVHEKYPGRGCAIALEFKKFFMDEWTGVPDAAELQAMRAFITFVAAEAARMLQ